MNINEEYNNLSNFDKYIYYVRSIGKEYIEMPEDINNELDIDNVNNYINSLCNEEIKEMMIDFFKQTKYISFYEFKKNLYDSFNKFLEIIENKGKEYYLVLHTPAYKSNYWCALLIFLYLDENKEKKRPIKVINNLSISIDELSDNVFLYLDDASYSGTQLSQDLENQISSFESSNRNGGGFGIKKLTPEQIEYRKHLKHIIETILKPNIYLCTTYISDIAINKLKLIIPENNIIYYAKMERLDDHMNKIYNKYFLPLLRNENLFREKGDITIGLKEQRYPIYFDHKIADFFSSYPEIYQLGLLPICDDISIETNGIPNNTLYIDEEKYKYIPLFKSCEGKGYTLFNFDDTDDKSTVCKMAFYKQRHFSKNINVNDDEDSAYNKGLSQYKKEKEGLIGGKKSNKGRYRPKRMFENTYFYSMNKLLLK